MCGASTGTILLGRVLLLGRGRDDRGPFLDFRPEIGSLDRRCQILGQPGFDVEIRGAIGVCFQHFWHRKGVIGAADQIRGVLVVIDPDDQCSSYCVSPTPVRLSDLPVTA